MLRKLLREIWCILIQWLTPCAAIQRRIVRRKLAALRKRMEEAAKKKAAAQLHHSLMRTNAIYKNRHKTINFLRNTPRMWSFIDLAAAHYNTQIDRGLGEYYIKPDFDSKLDIAEDYFIRDRAGLVEWWCKFTKDGRKFLGEEAAIKQDLGIPFHDVFVDISRRAYGIEVKPDSVGHLKRLICPCMDSHGNPNTKLMKEVAARANVH